MKKIAQVVVVLLSFIGPKAFAKDIGIHFGYIDQRPYDSVLDLNLSQELISALQQPCNYQNHKACGFDLVLTQDQVTVLIKDTHEITISTASVTTSDDANRTSYKSSQVSFSNTAETLFHESLRSRDAILYVGHSRFGSGPDFLFPRLRSDGTVDKQFYLQNHTGGKKAAMALSQSIKAYQEVSLISCDADKHFEKKLSQKFPQKKFYFAQGLQYPSQLVGPVLNNLEKILK